jgi:TonB family protein
MEPPIRESQPDRSSTPAPILDGQLHFLLSDIRDDVSSYRRREATWFSVAFHAALLLALIFTPKLVSRSPVLVPVQPKQNTIFLDMPDTTIKAKTPKTNILSDKDRVAQAPTPLPDRRTLRELIDARRRGQPKPPQTPAEPAQQAAQPSPPAAPPAPAQPEAVQQAKIQAPPAPTPAKNPFAIRSGGSAVDQAIHSVANGRIPNPSTSSDSGDYGTGLHPRIDNRAATEILSDTMGVDFGPYMRRLHIAVQDHWDPLIPESARPPIMKRGVVVIEFDILRDGRIVAIKLVRSSGDVALDKAALGAISGSTPLQALPPAYTNDYLVIRAAFYYNPEKNAFE